jgi:anti-sigma factor RsiW
MPACSWVVESASDFVDGTLGQAHTKMINRHLIRCRACSRYVDQIRQTASLLRSLATPAITPRYGRAVVEAFRSSRQGR